MALWYEGPLAGFGTVATGADSEADHILSAALAVQLTADPPPRARVWHAAPGRCGLLVESLARALAVQSEAGVPLVVVNAPFGLTLLDRELARHRGTGLADRLRRSSLCVLDPLVLDRHLDGGRAGGRSLGELCAHYGVAAGEPAAAGEAGEAVAAVLLARALGRRHAPRLARFSAAQLHTRQAVWYASRARGLPSWCAPVATGLPVPPAWPLCPPPPPAPPRQRVSPRAAAPPAR